MLGDLLTTVADAASGRARVVASQENTKNMGDEWTTDSALSSPAVAGASLTVLCDPRTLLS
jgi:hypothetical protein